jgi:2-polyprenyl-3-methyl-5-hydroxy-6-metoxy-1,4-benzoquinol methylase
MQRIFRHQVCPVCGCQTGEKLFDLFHDKSKVLPMLGFGDKEPVTAISFCGNCGHHYMNPIIDDHAMDLYYSKINSEFYENSSLESVEQNRKTYRAYIDLIKKVLPRGRVLEIGCGRGFLLKMLTDAGYQCSGVEPSPMASSFAREHFALDVETGYLAGSSFHRQAFDLVVLVDVLEHISDVQSFLQSITHVLKPGGHLFLCTGNVGSFTARFAGPRWGYFLSWEHISFFTPGSMKFLLGKHGFNDIEVTKASVEHKWFQNCYEFFKNGIKKVVNRISTRKYYHGLCFDHMIVLAKYSKITQL